MSRLKARIIEISRTQPELSSTQIAEQLYCHPSYVRCVWNRSGCSPRSLGSVVSKTDYLNAMAALKDLFTAITEEGIDVEAAIVRAENVIVASDGAA